MPRQWVSQAASYVPHKYSPSYKFPTSPLMPYVVLTRTLPLIARRPHTDLLRPLPLPIPAPQQPNTATHPPIPTIAPAELAPRTSHIQSILNLENEKHEDQSRDAGGGRTVEERFAGGDVEGSVEWRGGGDG